MRNYICLAVLCFVVLLSTSAAAVPVTPGGLVIEGSMYITGDPVWDSDSGTWVSEDGWWPFGIPSWDQPPWWDGPGDPEDLMYHDSSEIGVRESVFDVPLGCYESGGTAWLGHAVHAFDLTVRAATSGVWSDSQNLLLELRSPMPGVDEVYWSATGPFSSEPLHVYVELPQPVAGYEVRLTAIPDVPPSTTLVIGLGLLAFHQRRRRA